MKKSMCICGERTSKQCLEDCIAMQTAKRVVSDGFYNRSFIKELDILFLKFMQDNNNAVPDVLVLTPDRFDLLTKELHTLSEGKEVSFTSSGSTTEKPRISVLVTYGVIYKKFSKIQTPAFLMSSIVMDEYKKVTGFNNPAEAMAVEEHEIGQEKVWINEIREWDGVSTNSALKQVLADKFKQLNSSK